MLQRICFCIAGEQEDGERDALIARAQAHLASEGIRACVLAPDETDPAKHPETLYLTDDPAIARTLTGRGGRVAGFLHGKNRDEKFTGLKFVFDEPDEVEVDSYSKAWERLSGLPWTILHTKRLTIRETTVDDVDDFYRIYRDPSMTAFQDGLFDDPEDERRYMADYISRIYGLFGFGVWTVLLRDTGEVIGRAGFSVRNGFEEIELGFMIAKPHQGRGYAFEACEAILRYGRQVLMLTRVQAMVREGNDASMHLCEKLGFKRTGSVQVEEEPYGSRYGGEGMVSFAPTRYGTYIRFIKEMDTV